MIIVIHAVVVVTLHVAAPVPVHVPVAVKEVVGVPVKGVREPVAAQAVAAVVLAAVEVARILDRLNFSHQGYLGTISILVIRPFSTIK